MGLRIPKYNRMTPKYTDGTLTLEAVQFKGDNQSSVLHFLYPDLDQDSLEGAEAMGAEVVVETRDGIKVAPEGSIIAGPVDGKFIIFHEDDFNAQFTPVEA